MGRPRPFFTSPSPSPRGPSPETSPRLSSALDDSPIIPTSGPFSSSSSSSSLASSTGTAAPPSLDDILSGSSRRPWTLSAFMTYLCHNHCMETLEFTVDVQRYAAAYTEMSPEHIAQVASLWDKLMVAYLVPGAPRELNLPSSVRDHLLGLQTSPLPPDPCCLRRAATIVHDLMNDSLLLPFIEWAASLAAFPPSVAPFTSAKSTSPESTSSMSRSNRIQSRALKLSTPYAPFVSPITHSPAKSLHCRSASSGSTSASVIDLVSPFSSIGVYPHRLSQCPSFSTPPSTPPLPDSPTMGFQRVTAAHHSAWRKVKSGFFRRTKSGQISPVLPYPEFNSTPA